MRRNANIKRKMNKKITEQDIIDAISQSLNKELPKSKTSYRIKFNGQFIRTSSGNTVWTTISAAKNAFNHHCRGYLGLFGSKTGDRWNNLSVEKALVLLKTDDEYNKDSRLYYKQFVQKLIDSKILEFVEMKEYLC